MKRPITSSTNTKRLQQQSQQQNDYSEDFEGEEEDNYYAPDSIKENDLTSFIYTLFSEKIYAEEDILGVRIIMSLKYRKCKIFQRRIIISKR